MNTSNAIDTDLQPSKPKITYHKWTNAEIKIIVEGLAVNKTPHQLKQLLPNLSAKQISTKITYLKRKQEKINSDMVKEHNYHSSQKNSSNSITATTPPPSTKSTFLETKDFHNLKVDPNILNFNYFSIKKEDEEEDIIGSKNAVDRFFHLQELGLIVTHLTDSCFIIWMQSIPHLKVYFGPVCEEGIAIYLKRDLSILSDLMTFTGLNIREFNNELTEKIIELWIPSPDGVLLAPYDDTIKLDYYPNRCEHGHTWIIR
ncbi:hypothetical protein HDU92_007623 [Lobulomyces angularis]|nr:hypothetical protein HDU92_007623 [Lobulomyces angularis]